MLNTPTGAAGLSIVSNSLLIAIKLAAGLLSGSISIISEAIHSGMDLLASLIAFFSLRIAGAPADEKHPFGHGKFENVSGALEAGLIFAAAVFIVLEAMARIRTGVTVRFAEIGIVVMAVSVVMNLAVSRYLLRMARIHDSLALEADARHLTTDVFTSLGVLVGLGIVRLTGLHWLDPMVAIGVALLITKTAADLTRKAMAGLVDTSLPPKELDIVRAAVSEHAGEIIGFHELRSRKAGKERYIDLHLVFAKDAHVEEAHRLCDHMEADVRTKLPNSNVTIHIEPCPLDFPECPAKCPLSRDNKCQPPESDIRNSPSARLASGPSGKMV
ncbi:MAG: cation transporter [Chloroflexi bacterium]|nr:cation transporter [Chloroflexota bacterium]